MKARRLAHRFVQQQGNDPAVKIARSALKFFAQPKTPHDALPLVILFEREFHAASIRAATAEARVIRFWIELHWLLIFICQTSQATRVLVAQASACGF
jgi:hypothetical protein